MHGFGSITGNFTLSATSSTGIAPNATCNNAVALTNGGTVTASTVGGQISTAPAIQGVSVTSPGVWYSFQGNGGPAMLETCGGTTNFDTRLCVYSGACGTLVGEAANDDFCNTQSKVAMNTTVSGQTYMVLVHGFGSQTGDFSLKLDQPTPPANNLPCGATPLTFGTPTAFDNTDAIAVQGEPVPGAGSNPGTCNQQDGWCFFEPDIQNTVYFSFVAPVSGCVSILAQGFDTQVALWKAVSCSTYTSFDLIAANDDSGNLLDPNLPPSGPSAIVEAACLTPGETYYVQVDGFNGAAGQGTVTLFDCGNAPLTVDVGGCQTQYVGFTATARDTNFLVATPAGGFPPYTVEWLPDPSILYTNPEFNGIAVQPNANTNYTAVVTDAKGCTVMGGVDVEVVNAACILPDRFDDSDTCCKGGVAIVTMVVSTPGDYLIHDGGTTIASYPNAVEGDSLIFGTAGTRLADFTITVSGLGSWDIHTSCSDNIIGDYWDFKIVNHTDKEGHFTMMNCKAGGLDNTGMYTNSGGSQECCKGGMQEITLRIIEPGTYEVTDDGVVIASITNAAAGDSLIIEDGGQKLGNLLITYVGLGSWDLHTSCSVNIIGNYDNYFEILNHTDENGNFTESNCKTGGLVNNGLYNASNDCCEDGITAITIEITTPGDYTVTDDNGVTLAAQNGAIAGDILIVGDSTNKVNKNLTLTIAGLGSWDIHASCSKNIIGDYGDFKLLNHIDGRGNFTAANCETGGLYNPGMITPGNGACCDGGMQIITLRVTTPGDYIVTEGGTTISSLLNAAAGDTLIISDNGQKLGNLLVTLAGYGSWDLHTSCSKNIIGDYGDFEILNHTDDNGNYTEVNCKDGGVLYNPSDDCCKDGITAITVEVTTPGDYLVLDESNDTVLWAPNAMAGNILAMGDSITKLDKNLSLIIGGLGSWDLHTSCSKRIIGDYGDFKVLNHQDFRGNLTSTNCEPGPLETTGMFALTGNGACCDGGMQIITLRVTTPGDYVVTEGGVTISSLLNAAAGDTLIISDNGQKLGNLLVTLAGYGSWDLHTSCSKNIIGDYGDFEILNHTDDNGNYTEVNCKDGGVLYNPGVYNPSDDCCKDGITAITVEVTTPGDYFVKDESGDTIAALSGAIAGDILIIGDSTNKLDKSLTITIAGVGNWKIHTSCSRNIIGDYGDFEILDHTDDNGNFTSTNCDGGGLTDSTATGNGTTGLFQTGVTFCYTLPNGVGTTEVCVHPDSVAYYLTQPDYRLGLCSNSAVACDQENNPFPEPLPCEILTLTMAGDFFGGVENSWNLIDLNTGEALGSNVTVNPTPTVDVYNWCVNPTHCYEFTIFDAFGDGFAFGGSYQLDFLGVTITSPFADPFYNPLFSETQTIGTSTANKANIEMDKQMKIVAYPNPFSEEATIDFTLLESAKVTLEVYTITGQ